MTTNNGISGFANFIFHNEPFCRIQCLRVYESLAYQPRAISFIFKDEEACETFLSGFDCYAKRVAQFFARYPVKSGITSWELEQMAVHSPGLQEEVLEGFISPLLREYYGEVRSEAVFVELLESMIQFIIQFKPSCFGPLMKLLGETNGLLERLVSDERGSTVIQMWPALARANNFDTKVFENWTTRIINLCESCQIDHGIHNVITKWEKLSHLKVQLNQALQASQSSDIDGKALPLLREMRRLSVDDKKSRRITERKASISLQFTNDVILSLGSFGVQTPTSDRTLAITIEKLETDETISIFEKAIQTFPCRPCWISSGLNIDKPVQTRALTGENEYSEDVDGGSFEEQLGSFPGIWKVVLSGQALKDLKKSEREGNFEHIRTKLVDLASGDWRRRSLVRRAGTEGIQSYLRVPLFKAAYGDNGRILWQVDVGFDERSGQNKQFVKIWNIGDHKEMDKAIAIVLQAQKNYTDDRAAASTKKLFEKSTGLNTPIPFGGICLTTKLTDSNSRDSTADHMALDASEICTKFYILTETIFDNILRGNSKAVFPFDVSEEEIHIIKYFKTSAFILGRSGTGKTTCLIYKLLSRYLARNAIEKSKPIHQMLLTRSSLLSEKLKDYSKRLIDSQLGRSKPEAETDYRDIYYKNEEETTETLFSLKDEDFPLVCTFDYFLELMENTIKMADRRDFSYMRRRGESFVRERRGSIYYTRQPQIVDFTLFSVEYWKLFPPYLTKDIPVESAFAEIIGVIKGSTSLETRLEPLSKEDYRNKSWKQAPVFTSENERDQIYAIYEKYEKIKAKFGDTDDIDRVKYVLQAIENDAALKEKVKKVFDEVYVDEIQDQRPLEIRLLLSLIRNPRGIHFAGDTAQCISKDSTFRFANVKALFYEQFVNTSNLASDATLAKPHLFSLSQNFRSHQGILSLARLIMELLWTGFPDSIDKLEPEVGQYTGPKPLIFAGFDSEIFDVGMKEHSEGHASEIEFGADQTIIVRTIDDKKQLQADIGDMAMVITILESKGMEFDDVVLYNFFSTSPCPNSIRSLDDLLNGGFDARKHLALCSELKHLYVAITRPRARLWIVERHSEAVSPVLSLLTQKAPGAPLVDVFSDGSIDEAKQQFKRFAESGNDPEKWIARGYDFMSRKNFFEALFCFKKANYGRGKNLAGGHQAEQEGKGYRASGEDRLFREEFHKAIECFLKIGLHGKAAACHEDLEEFIEAAEIWVSHGKYVKGAKLFEKAKYFEKAAYYYHESGEYEKAADALRKGEHFNGLVRYLNDNGDNIGDVHRRRYSRLCNLLLKQGKIDKSLGDMTVASLGSDSEKEKILKEFAMTPQLMDFYNSEKRYQEEYDLAIKTGDFKKALEIANNHELDQQTHSELIKVFDYVHAEHLYSTYISEGCEIPGGFINIDPLSPICGLANQFLSKGLLWGQLHAAVDCCFNSGIRDDEINQLQEEWMRNILDTIVTSKTLIFLDSALTMDDLHVESITRFMGMAKIIICKQIIPLPLLIFLGIFKLTKEPGNYMILQWSPLNSGPNNSCQILDTKSILEKVRKWTLEQICEAVFPLLDKAGELWRELKSRRCPYFLVQGYCKKYRSSECKHLHENFTGAQYSDMINQCLRVNFILATLSPFYQRRKLDSTSSKKFRGVQRGWLERLLKEITYISSFEQCAVVLAQAKCEIFSPDSKFSVISRTIQELLFFRLRFEWDQRKGFSSLLEQVQLSQELGVAGWYMKALHHQTLRTHRQNRDNKLQSAQQMLHAFLRMNGYARNGNCQYFLGHLTVLLRGLEHIRSFTEQFFSFSSILSLYENLVTFLIFMVRPNDFIIPKSWAVMYFLPEWLNIPKTQDERIHYVQGLVDVVDSFCGLVANINAAFYYTPPGQTSRFGFSFSGNPIPKEFLGRRSTDFLAVCMTNMVAMAIPPAGLKNLWGHVQQTLCLGFLKADHLRSSLQLFGEDLARSFDKYNGKDSLIVFVKKGNTLPKVFANLGKYKVSAAPVGSILQSAAAPQSEIDKGVPESSPYSSEDLNAIKVIAEFWRKHHPILVTRRLYLETPFGEAVDFIQKLCKNEFKDIFQLQQPDCRIKSTSAFANEGVTLYMNMQKVEARFDKVQQSIKDLIEHKHLSSSFLDLLQDQSEKLVEIGKLLERTRTLFTKDGISVLDLSRDSLRKTFYEANKTLKEIKRKTEEAENELEAIHKTLK